MTQTPLLFEGTFHSLMYEHGYLQGNVKGFFANISPETSCATGRIELDLTGACFFGNVEILYVKLIKLSEDTYSVKSQLKSIWKWVMAGLTLGELTIDWNTGICRLMYDVVRPRDHGVMQLKTVDARVIAR